MIIPQILVATYSLRFRLLFCCVGGVIKASCPDDAFVSIVDRATKRLAILGPWIFS